MSSKYKYGSDLRTVKYSCRSCGSPVEKRIDPLDPPKLIVYCDDCKENLNMDELGEYRVGNPKFVAPLTAEEKTLIIKGVKAGKTICRLQQDLGRYSSLIPDFIKAKGLSKFLTPTSRKPNRTFEESYEHNKIMRSRAKIYKPGDSEFTQIAATITPIKEIKDETV